MTTHADGMSAGGYSGAYAPPTPAATPSPPPESSVAPPPRSAAAGRRTSRRALIISVLVVLIGGLLAFAGSQVLTKHTRVLAVAQNVPVGATITSGDLTVASVTKDPNLLPIPAADSSQIVGMVAQVALVKGELLTRAQVGPSTGFSAGQMLVALPLKQGQFPARGLVAGQKVLIVSTPGANGSTSSGAGSGSDSSQSPPSSGSGAGGVAATVADVGGMNQATQVTVVDVRVDQSNGATVAQMASTGNLAVILLPVGR